MGSQLQYLKRASEIDGYSSVAPLLFETTIATSPFSPSLIRSLYWKHVPDYYRRLWSKRGIAEYDVPIDPAKTVWVSPKKITHFTNRNGRPHRWRELDIGRVLPGDWDRGGRTFNEHILHKSLSQRFVEGSSWEDTPIVKRTLKTFREDGATSWSCQSKPELIEKCRKIDCLYADIRKNGIKSQYQLWQSEGLSAPSFRDLVVNNIMVDISRKGELLLVDSKHRLSIAKILDLESIPVSFLVRHREWMERISCLDRTDCRYTHPDLRQFE